MKIVVAPDSFKGSLSPLQAAMAIKRGLVNVWPDAKYVLFPVSDGGEGFAEALVYLEGGSTVKQECSDPFGRKISAAWGLLGDGVTAVVELASACGLLRLKPKDLNPGRASTYGFGEQIRAALDRGVRKLVLGLGGSATNDAGAGMLEALGMRLLKADGSPVDPGAQGLVDLASLDASRLHPGLREADITVACAVKNPLTGPNGTSQIFGPRKGATNQLIPVMDGALDRFHSVAGKLAGRDVSAREGAGAAGGVGAALMLFTGAVFEKGVQVLLTRGKFREKAEGADLIITGEGKTDFETLWWGKAPLGVSAAGNALGIPTIAIAACLEQGYQRLYDNGMAAVMGMLPSPMTHHQSLGAASTILEDAAWRLARILSVDFRAK
ncbi:MAG: glycerate kinase [Deltaproteobacteria bacterium]|jgi:glycerate kinase|nr:glycerate kinase [Deltaproteobacteria bacterium]